MTSGWPSGVGSKPALRSAPEENARPAPVMVTERTAGSVVASSTAARRSRPNWVSHAFIVSGRLSSMRSSAPLEAPRRRVTVSAIGGILRTPPLAWLRGLAPPPDWDLHRAGARAVERVGRAGVPARSLLHRRHP